MMDQQAKQENIKEQKRFSVIVASYNTEEYIERAILSVENQTFKNIEVIIVDDCSTDNTEKEILKLCAKYPNITYIRHEENKRAGAVRNTGLGIAKGEYIIFLDSDDYLAENTVFEKIDKLIGEDKTDIIYLGFKIEGNREELVIPTEETCTKTYKTAIDPYPNVWSKCYRREFLDENNIRFAEYRLYEDLLFVYNSVMKSESYKIADFVVHKYISGRPNSITTKINFKNIEDTVANLRDLFEMRESEYTKEIDMIIKKEIGKFKDRLDDISSKI